MNARFFALFLMVLLAATGYGQATVKLTFDSAVKRLIWIGDSVGDSKPISGVEVEANSFDLKATATGGNSRVFVWNLATGNIASKPLPEALKGWSLKATDENIVAQMQVRVEYKGRPVETASVEIKDGMRTQGGLIDSAAKGVAEFWGIAPKPVKVSVKYRSQGKDADPVEMTFNLSTARKSAVPVFVVSVPEETATVDPGPAGSTSEQPVGTPTGQSQSGQGTSPPPQGTSQSGVKDTTNPIGKIVTFLIALAVAAAAVWFGFQWIKKNQTQVQNKLEQMGVEIPVKPDDVAQQAQSAAPIVPEPPQKIVLGDADPNVSPISTPAVSQPGIPRLIQESGATFNLSEGENVIGRETGTIVIAGETSLSRKHAVLTLTGGSARITDAGSTNGTFVNGLQISGETELRPGDAVQCGAIRFRFEG